MSDAERMTASIDDWATKAAREIAEGMDEIPAPCDEMRVEILASIITTHAAPLVALLQESKREHNDQCAVGTFGDCNCGADAHNAKIDEMLK